MAAAKNVLDLDLLRMIEHFKSAGCTVFFIFDDEVPTCETVIPVKDIDKMMSILCGYHAKSTVRIMRNDGTFPDNVKASRDIEGMPNIIY